MSPKLIDTQFEPRRLRLARELRRLSQADVAVLGNLTAAAVSQFESGAVRPALTTQSLLADLLAVPARFFELPLVDTHDGFFRSLRRTSVADRRSARAFAHIAHDIIVLASEQVVFPLASIPRLPAVSLSSGLPEIEQLAIETRRAWNVQPGPAPSLVDLLETHGVAVLRLPLGSADVDAFSLPFGDHPVVVLASDKNDRARSRFDAAHELGHLVMHGELLWGMPEIEKQAHQFAAAFLMPAVEIVSELPPRVDWPALFELKRKWQVSLAALLMRAKTLGRMTEATYLTAVKAASARGWRRVEPVPLGTPEPPTGLVRLLRGKSTRDLKALFPADVLDTIAAA